MNRKQEYQAYLRSPTWQSRRKEVFLRSDGKCEMCGDQAKHVHHVRYPKQFKDDTEHNLLALCESCHMRTHAVRAEKKEANIVPINGTRAVYHVRSVDHNGDTWMQIDDFKLAIEGDCIAMGSRANAGAFMALEREMESDEWAHFEVDHKGISKTLKFINEMGAARLSLANIQCTAARNVRQFYKNLHKEHRQRQSIDAPAQIANDAASLMAIVSEGMSKYLAPVFHGQNVRFDTIEKAIPTMRDPNESITVAQAIQEKGYVQNTLFPGTRQNLEQYTGNQMRKRFEPIGKESQRLSGVSVVTTVNKYRRGDIYPVLEEVMDHIRRS